MCQNSRFRNENRDEWSNVRKFDKSKEAVKHHKGREYFHLDVPIDQALVRNPKARFPDAGKLLVSLAKPKP